MNPSVTSRQAILDVCRAIVAEKGVAALNMRAVAQECRIAPGTLYHYYADKDALVLATVESIWQEILCDGSPRELPFPEYVAHLFDCLQQSARQYPKFLPDCAMRFATAGQTVSFDRLRAALLEVLHADRRIGRSAFSRSFTEEDLADFVLGGLMLQLARGQTSCAALVELVRRAIYR
ncbi:MAG: TetR/AcrR family transcriptional regulator [Gemmiger sp.]